MDAWWYFEEGRGAEPIKRSISHVKQKQVCMLFYERVVFRGSTLRRRARAASGSSARDVKQRQKATAPAVGQKLAGDALPGVWSEPRRPLKRYPSWVDGLRLKEVRHARFERLAEEKARECFRARACEAGANEFVEDVTESSMGEFEHVDEYAKLSACVLRVFRRLQEDTGNPQFASLCGGAYVFF